MPEKEILLTQAGLSKLEQELDHLKTVKRREIAARIKQAIEFGDISENSEYDDAKNEQAYIEGRIHSLETMLRHSRVIDEDELDTATAAVGTHVKVKDLSSNDVYDFLLVGSAEADPSQNKISNESPVGRALLGQEVGAVVEVQVPAGTIRYKLLEITR